MFISYVKFNCSDKFKINEHRFKNYIFSVILREFRYKFLFFPHNYRVLHKTLLRPYVRTPPPPRPSFGSRPEIGNHLDKQIHLLSESYTTEKYSVSKAQDLECWRQVVRNHCSSKELHLSATADRLLHSSPNGPQSVIVSETWRRATQAAEDALPHGCYFTALEHKHQCCRYKYVRCGRTAGRLPWVHRPQPRCVLKFKNKSLIYRDSSGNYEV